MVDVTKFWIHTDIISDALFAESPDGYGLYYPEELINKFSKALDMEIDDYLIIE